MRGLRELERDNGGAAAIEFAFLVPILLVIMFAAVALYVLFRDAKTAEKSTFTVGDIVSRKTSVDTDFLKSSYTLFLRMTERDADEVRFRISSLKKGKDAFKVDWSYAVAPQKMLSDADIPVSKLPLVSEGDSLVVVETIVVPTAFKTYFPMLASDYQNSEYVRPRFTAAVSKTD
jgi:Flp pilus assembly protein TadG